MGTTSSIGQPLQKKLADGNWAEASVGKDEMIRVQITTEPESLSAGKSDVTNLGGELKGEYGQTIIAELPAKEVMQLGEKSSIRRVDEYVEPQPHDPEPIRVNEGTGTVSTSSTNLPVTEGVEITGADEVQDIGVTGQNATIAILDVGPFDVNNDAYKDQVVGTLGPDPSDSVFSDAYEQPGGHGDSCAEIVGDMAPDADLVLGYWDSTGSAPLITSFFDLMDTLETEFPGVDAASMSVGFLRQQPIDGTDDISNRIDDFTDNGRFFVTSAGNDGSGGFTWTYDEQNDQPVQQGTFFPGAHWDGEFTDTAGNNLMEFDSDLQNTERFPIWLLGPGYVTVHWDADRLDDDQRYEVRVYDSPSASSPVDTAQTTEPWESVLLFDSNFTQVTDPFPTAYIEIEGVENSDGQLPDFDHHFDIFTFIDTAVPNLPGTLDVATDPRSIGIPGTADDDNLFSVAAVQAVDVETTGTAANPFAGDLKSYSSQGPTQDFRQGIDIAGPSHVSTNSRGPVEDTYGFNGTSAAAPHVAGTIGLLTSGTSALLTQIRDSLNQTGTPIADPDVSGTNNTQIGSGQVNAAGAYATLEPDVTVPDQAFDRTASDTEIFADVTAPAGHYVVVTETANDYAGESVLASTQLADDAVEKTVTLDVGQANPVDHAVHVASDLSSDTANNGTISQETLSNVEVTDEAAVYNVNQFNWTDERQTTSAGTITVDTVEISYNGSLGPTTISIDLHEVDDNGNPAAFVGVSQNDLAVNTVHNDVAVDVVEPVDPSDQNPTRVEDTIDALDDYFAMAHIGPAGTDSNGDRIPAQKPALVTTESPGTIGDFSTVEVPTVRLNTQALDFTANDTELRVQDVTADQNEYVVVTTDSGNGDFLGEDVAGFTQLGQNVTEETVLIDVSGSSPVDHAAHIVSDLSQSTIDNGTVSQTTLNNVESTSGTAAVYAVSQFNWQSEQFDDVRGTITVDTVEIAYNGSVGEDKISIDLHEVDQNGDPAAFVGVSQNDLDVNTVYNDVAVDVLEPRGPGDDSPRVEDELTETDDYFAMAHLGPAGTDSNGDRIPAQKPALVTTESPGTVGDFATAIRGEVSISAAQGTISVPPRKLLISEDTDSRLGSGEYSLELIRTAQTGDSIEVNVGAPDALEYQVELRDSDLNLAGVGAPNQSGNTTETFDTGALGLDPGTYLFAPVRNNEALAVLPLIVEAYDADITAAPQEITTTDILEVDASLSEVASNPPAVDQVMLFGFTDSDQTGLVVEMNEATGTNNYTASVEGPEADQYQLHVAPRGGDNISFEIQSMTVESETTSGDTSSIDDTSQNSLISVSGAEPLGLSEKRDLTVTLSDSDTLSTVWSQQTGTSNVDGQLQFSRTAINDGNVYVGGLDEAVTAHARNSGEQRWEVTRAGSLSDSSPILYGGRVYIGDGGGLFHAIDAGDGTQEWSLDTAASSASDGSAVTSTAAVADLSGFSAGDVAVFGANDGVVHAVEDQGGSPQLLWSTDIGSAVFSEVEIGEVSGAPWAFVTTNDGRVVVLDILGQVESNAGDVFLDVDAPTDSFGASSPVLDGGVLYVAGDQFHALDVQASASQGSAVFNYQRSSNYDGPTGSNPVVADGIAYVGRRDGSQGQVVGFSADDSGTLEFFGDRVSQPIATTPAIVGDRVVAASLDGSVYVFSRFTGDLVDSRDLGAAIRSDPVVRNGNIYIGTDDGEVLSLQNIP